MLEKVVAAAFAKLQAEIEKERRRANTLELRLSRVSRQRDTLRGAVNLARGYVQLSIDLATSELVKQRARECLGRMRDACDACRRDDGQK